MGPQLGSRAMGSVTLEPASAYSHAELAEIFNAGYEGYYTPFALDEATFRFMSTVWDDDLDASRVAVAGGEPAGICKLAIRGERGWIAGVGIAVPHRGQGIGEALMLGVIDEARTRGLQEIWLEVLVQNEPAIRLYEKLGFERERELEVWSLAGGPGEAAVVDLDEALTAIRARRTWREPWQRADETVANYRELDPPPVGLAAADGAAVVRASGGRVTLLQLAADSEAGIRSLLADGRSLGESLAWLNLPAGDPAAAVLDDLGGRIDHRQLELVLRL